MSTFTTIRESLADWYQKHQRDLPWRQSNDPYCIWISEVILQQTRVDQGTAYYHRFIERFPTVTSLAKAKEDEVLKLWQGLGYYSRARNLHKAAGQILERHGGKFPSDYDQIKDLQGIGPYTAAAISSIAFQIPVAAVDGNVSRVVSRLFGVQQHVNKNPGMRMIDQLARELLDTNNPSQHNQAMMEFGALQCIPKNPDCGGCILTEHCEARHKGLVAELPMKYKTGKRKSRFFHYFIINAKQKFAIQQRAEKDIWQGLYEFPLIEKTKEGALHHDDFVSIGLTEGNILRVNEVSKHVLSHQDLFARFYHVDVKEEIPELSFVPALEVASYALPRLIDRYLEQHDLKTGEKR